jgi:hypothetical protein
MAQFSTMARIVVEKFAENLGLSAQVAPDHSYGFVLARSGTLSLVPSEDGKRIIVSLARVPNRSDIAMQLRFFDLAGLHFGASTCIHAGIAPDETMVLATDVDEERFDMQSLDETLSRLIELQNAVF